MTYKAKNIIYACISALLALLLYILLHELGHMIVMLYAGAAITDFSILTAHVSAVGGDYNNFTDLWLNANGALFPVTIAAIYAVLYQKNKGRFYKIFSFVFIMGSTISLLAWTIIPLIYIQGNAPSNEDVTKFLESFSQQYHPLIVSAVSLLLIVGIVIIVVKKGIWKNYISTMKDEGV